MKKQIVIFLIFILGFVLRVIFTDINPPGLTVDEVSIGYNAFSILKTSRDEYGKFMPFNFKSLGDYKPPLYVYLTAVSERFLGLNELAVRFASILFGSLTVFLIYLLLTKITNKSFVGLVGGGLLAISPWHIFYSRMASEAVVALFLVVTGTTFLVYSKKTKIGYLFIAGLMLALSAYCYHSEKVFTPLYVLFSYFYFGNKNRKYYFVFLLVFVVFYLPIIVTSIVGGGLIRAQMTFIGNDPDFLNIIYKGKYYYGHLFFHWLRKYLSYFNPKFIFFDGLDLLKGEIKIGLLYIFEIPLVFLGALSFLKQKSEYKYMTLSWLVISPIPASITFGEYHPIRPLLTLPVLLLFSSLGAYYLISNERQMFYWVSFSALVLWNLFWVIMVFSIHFPIEKGESYFEKTKEAVLYVVDNENKYDEVVIDPRTGIDGPYIRGVPQLYYLFYKKQDPAEYINSWRVDGEGVYRFGKISVREINWKFDQHRKDVLLVGSPWSYRLEDVKEEEILRKIYMKDGHTAYLIVSPHGH